MAADSAALYAKSLSGPFLLAGPCVLESRQLALDVARELAGISERLSLPIVFKSSFDKANRTSVTSFRGPGMAELVATNLSKRYGEREVVRHIALDIHDDQHGTAIISTAAILNGLRVVEKNLSDVRMASP